jgi:hypothetical protein
MEYFTTLRQVSKKLYTVCHEYGKCTVLTANTEGEWTPAQSVTSLVRRRHCQLNCLRFEYMWYETNENVQQIPKFRLFAENRSFRKCSTPSTIHKN